MTNYDDRYLKMVTRFMPSSNAAEAFKAIRANIDVFNHQSYKSILITSALDGEGKSIIAANLATAFAQSGKATIYIDCNLRQPVGHLCFNLLNDKGISNFLTGQCKLTEIVKRTETENLYVITAGDQLSNPSELVATEKLRLLLDKLAAKADYIIVDSPKVEVADTTSLAAITDTSIMVVNINKSTKNEVRKAINQLSTSSNKVIGIVGNE